LRSNLANTASPVTSYVHGLQWPDGQPSKTGRGKIADRFGMSVDDYNARAVAGGAIERIGEPEEVAALARFFASGLSGATTGQSVSVCGGFNMH
jgi:NAD(P)-dependent dehydrogenase (short-subunit alcohol dehydrogenase family)